MSDYSLTSFVWTFYVIKTPPERGFNKLDA
jgi:hypothetical protein